MVAILVVGWVTGHIFKLDTPMMNVAKFVQFGPVVSEEKIFLKVNDGRRRRKPSDEKTSLGQVS